MTAVISVPYHAARRDLGMGLGPAALLAARARAARDRGEFPLVLSGNCHACLGAAGGVGAVVWFDAHADFDTPDDNRSGFFDVMALSALTGGCWAAQCASIPGFAPVGEDRVVLVGARDLEPYQRKRLDRSAVRQVAELADLEPTLAGLSGDAACDPEGRIARVGVRVAAALTA